MRVAVLGPLEVTANDSRPVGVPGAKERLLLALLAAHAPDVVPLDRIVEALRDGDCHGPDGDAVHAAVSGLRVALEPGLPDRASGQYVLRRGRGYALAVPRGDVVSVEVDAAGRRLATVSVDHTAITWDMSTDGPRHGRGPADPETRLEAACAIAGRDLTPTEWRRVLPDRRWQPTCSDLL